MSPSPDLADDAEKENRPEAELHPNNKGPTTGSRYENVRPFLLSLERAAYQNICHALHSFPYLNTLKPFMPGTSTSRQA
jgi:hypothetical protein